MFKPRVLTMVLILLIGPSLANGAWPDFKNKPRDKNTVVWPDFKVSKPTIVKEEPADLCPNGQCGTVSRQGIFFRWRSR